MATTANTITDAAYRKVGIRSPSGEEDTEALEALNNMMSLWGTEFITPSIVIEEHSLTIAQVEYTIGDGGTIDKERPMSIVNASIEDLVTHDEVPLKILSAKEFNAITDKDEAGTPTGLYYQSAYPLGIIFLNKAPEAADILHLEFWGNFTELATLATAVTLPLEYKKALIYNLAVELAEDNSIELSPSVYRTAELSRILISRLVSANRVPSESEYPGSIGGILVPASGAGNIQGK